MNKKRSKRLVSMALSIPFMAGASNTPITDAHARASRELQIEQLETLKKIRKTLERNNSLLEKFITLQDPNIEKQIAA